MQFFRIATVIYAFSTLVELASGSAILTATSKSRVVTTLSTGSAFPTTVNTSLAPANASVLPPFIDTPMTWIGPSKGVNITLNGTASQIADQLKALDPHWTPHTKDLTSNTSHLESRSKGALLCYSVAAWNWPTADYLNVYYAAEKISDIGGEYISQPEICRLAECYDGAAVWVCNSEIDNSVIGSYVKGISDDCTTFQDTNICGQQFNTDGWNVIADAC